VVEIEKKKFCRTFKEKIHPIDKLIDKYEKQRLTKKLRNFLNKTIPSLIEKKTNISDTQKVL
jgi:Zn-dependent M32 family carboxypeptidase